MRRLLLLVRVGLVLAGVFSAVREGLSQQAGLPLEGNGPIPASAPATGLPPGVIPDHPGFDPSAQAAQPLQPALTPNPYPITPDAGAWVICAASYTGPDAPELARQLCEELRNRHKMKAYIFNHADDERVKQREYLEKFRQEHPGVPVRNRTVRIQEQCAVLVGGYKDSETAGSALPRIKNLPLPTLDLGEGKSAYDTVNLFVPDPETKRTSINRAKVNPFQSAFVVPNPTVPLPPKQQQKFDPFWKELNADEEYSLLRCPRAYTLVVKVYYGANVVQTRSTASNFLKVLGLGNQKPGEGLTAAAMQAHVLAELLRNPRLGFDAYVMHTRDRSIVTVGGFKALNDEDMQRVQRQLSALKFKAGVGGNDPVGLMASPMPMEVPRP